VGAPAPDRNAAEICPENVTAKRRIVMYGTIKKIVKDKGFGFIVPDDGSDDVFFHRSRLAPKVQFDDLREGDEVEFQVTKGEKGPQANNLKAR
jgi:CspA family cold shock protein